MSETKNLENRVWSHGRADGYIRKDTFGRIFIDECPTDQEHMLAPVKDGTDRRACRKYLDDILLPEEMFNRKVRLVYDIRIIAAEEN